MFDWCWIGVKEYLNFEKVFEEIEEIFEFYGLFVRRYFDEVEIDE